MNSVIGYNRIHIDTYERKYWSSSKIVIKELNNETDNRVKKKWGCDAMYDDCNEKREK